MDPASDNESENERNHRREIAMNTRDIINKIEANDRLIIKVKEPAKFKELSRKDAIDYLQRFPFSMSLWVQFTTPPEGLTIWIKK